MGGWVGSGQEGSAVNWLKSHPCPPTRLAWELLEWQEGLRSGSRPPPQASMAVTRGTGEPPTLPLEAERGAQPSQPDAVLSPPGGGGGL